jgi:hypothetical protein
MLIRSPSNPETLHKVRRLVLETGLWFVPVPRVASRSIRTKVGDQYGTLFAHEADLRGHGQAHEYRALFGEEIWENIFSFGFTRDPWDRLVSGYHFRSKFREIRHARN